MTFSRENSAEQWPLEAERLSLDDPLMECLAIISAEHGRRITAAALSAGLPLPGKAAMASPAVFIRAAERVRMKARLVRSPLPILAEKYNLPCIVALKDNRACILRGYADDRVVVTFPETPGERTTLPLSVLRERYLGYAFFVRPQGYVDQRGGPVEIESGRDWFWSAIWAHKKTYGEVMIAAVVVNFLAVASPLFTMNVYDRVIPNAAYDTLWVLAAGVFIAYLFDFILKNLRAHFVDAAGRRADNMISARIFEQMLSVKMDKRPPSAGVYAAYLKEFETLRDFFTSATILALIDFPFILFFIFLIWLIAGPVAMIPAAIIPAVIAVGFLLQKPLDKAVKASMRENSFKSALVFETLGGLETIKAQVAEGHMQRRWEELNETTSRTHVRIRMISAFGLNVAGLAAGLTSVGVVIYGTYLIAGGNITMGALIAAVILSGRAMAPLSSIASILTRWSQSREALARLNDLMLTPVERRAGQASISMPVMQGRIEFKDVAFRYPGQKTPALQQINLSIAPGERVGVIGPAGSGKTTMERLILNLYQPESGSVQVDGVDVRQIDPTDLRRNIGVVQQTPCLFYGTVRENITLGHQAAPDETVIRAAKIAGVMDFLRSSEAGLETQVGERGDWLSGGQRQAIAIARALLYDPPILLLDEPTASVDPGAERRLYEHLKKLAAGKTVLLVTHKSAVLGLVDKLILLDGGRVVTMGPRDEVIGHLQSRTYQPAVQEEK